jgi:hypothetical protein
LSLIARTIRSSELPAGAGTTIFTGLLGQAVCAKAGADNAQAMINSERRSMGRTSSTMKRAL